MTTATDHILVLLNTAPIHLQTNSK